MKISLLSDGLNDCQVGTDTGSTTVYSMMYDVNIPVCCLFLRAYIQSANREVESLPHYLDRSTIRGNKLVESAESNFYWI